MTAARRIRLLRPNEFTHVQEERLRLLLDHWIDRRGADLAPRRTAIDPAAIARLLPAVWMCDYEPARGRFRMRLAGEDINLLYGRNVNNCHFEEIIAPAMLADLLRRYRRVIEEPAAMHCAGHIYLASEHSQVGERLVLPLADESGALMHVIGASVFRAVPAMAAGPVIRESMVEIFTPLLQTGPAA